MNKDKLRIARPSRLSVLLSALVLILVANTVVTGQPIPGQVVKLWDGAQYADVTAGNALKVDGSASTQPVSGTVTANQGGTWTVQPGDTPNTVPWLTTINQGGNSATVTGGGALTVTGTVDSEFPAAAALSDAFANPTTTNIYSLEGLFNGSTWDRAREVVNGTNSTGTGIAAAGILAQFDDVSPGTITENQFSNVRMSTNRNLYTVIRDAAGNERGLNINSSGQITSIVAGSGGNAIDSSTGTPSTTGQGLLVRIIPGNGANDLGKNEDAPAGSGDIGVSSLARVNTSGATLAADGDYSNTAVDTLGRQLITGQVAHDAPFTGNPVMLAGYAATTFPTGVGSGGDATNLISDVFGRLVVAPYSTPGNNARGYATNTDGNAFEVIAAGGGTIRIAVTTITVGNSHASTSTFVEIKSGATNQWLVHLPPNSSQTITFPSPLIGGQNVNWNCDPGAAVTTIYCAISGHYLPS